MSRVSFMSRISLMSNDSPWAGFINKHWFFMSMVLLISNIISSCAGIHSWAGFHSWARILLVQGFIHEQYYFFMCRVSLKSNDSSCAVFHSWTMILHEHGFIHEQYYSFMCRVSFMWAMIRHVQCFIHEPWFFMSTVLFLSDIISSSAGFHSWAMFLQDQGFIYG